MDAGLSRGYSIGSMVILGVDWGEKRIGLAIRDEAGFVHPRGTVIRTSDREAVDVLIARIQEWGASEVVLGLPLNMDGSEGPAAARARKVARQLEVGGQVPVRLRDERLTSQEARTRLRQAGVSPEGVRERIDETAAVILLEDYGAELAQKAGRSE